MPFTLLARNKSNKSLTNTVTFFILYSIPTNVAVVVAAAVHWNYCRDAQEAEDVAAAASYATVLGREQESPSPGQYPRVRQWLQETHSVR